MVVWWKKFKLQQNSAKSTQITTWEQLQLHCLIELEFLSTRIMQLTGHGNEASVKVCWLLLWKANFATGTAVLRYFGGFCCYNVNSFRYRTSSAHWAKKYKHSYLSTNVSLRNRLARICWLYKSQFSKLHIFVWLQKSQERGLRLLFYQEFSLFI